MADSAPTTDTAAGDDRRIEKRLVGRALTHWEHLRGQRQFPAQSDYQDISAPYDEAEIFLIRVGTDEYSDEVVKAGSSVVTALGRNPVGMKAIDVLPSSTEMGLSFCRAAAQMKKPIADVGRFTNSAGQEVRYRCILLPLSDDQETINFVLGAFSYRIVE